MAIKISYLIRVLSIICAACLTISCANLKLKNLEIRPADSYLYSKSIEGLTVSVKPMTDSNDCMNYFGVDLISTGIVPILIIAENRHATSTYAIFREGITSQIGNRDDLLKLSNIEDKKNGVAKNTEGELTESAKTALAITAGVAAGLFLPVAVLAATPALIVASAKVASDSSIIKHNMANRELYTKTLLYGERMYGFIYLKVPDNIKSSDSCMLLNISAANLADNKKLNLAFTIPYQGGKFDER